MRAPQPVGRAHLHDDDRPDAVVAIAKCPDYARTCTTTAVAEALTALGGISHFVKAGATVLVKPNLVSPRPPDTAVTTHPAIVEAVVRSCVEAGAARVWVGDSSAGDHPDSALWGTTGIGPATVAAGGELRSFDGSEVLPVRVGERTVPCPAWFQDVDTFISVPKLKTHFLTTLTCGLKNSYGLVLGSAKALNHGTYPSPLSMSRFLVDIFECFRPHMTIVDSVMAMEGNGPTGGRPVNIGLVVAGTDTVAVDSTCARIAGLRPSSVPMIRLAADRRLGQAHPGSIRLVGSGVEAVHGPGLKLSHGRFLQRLPDRIYRVLAVALRYHPRIDRARCVACGACARVCSQKAISGDSEHGYRIDKEACIVCMCCMESCPRDAVYASSFGGWTQRIFNGSSKPDSGE